MQHRIVWIFHVMTLFSNAVSESSISHFFVEDVDQLNTYPKSVSYRPNVPEVVPKQQFFKCSRQETCTHVIWYVHSQESKSVPDIDSAKLIGEITIVWKKAVHPPKEVKKNPGMLICHKMRNFAKKQTYKPRLKG